MILERSSNAGVLVFAKDSASFEVLRTILKRSSTDPQTLAYWFLQYILQVLTCSKRFSNDPQTNLKRSSNARVLVFAMDSTSFEVLRMILKQTSNDPQTPAYWFLQWILQALKFSERSSNKPQTNLKRSSNAGVMVFAMDSMSFDQY